MCEISLVQPENKSRKKFPTDVLCMWENMLYEFQLSCLAKNNIKSVLLNEILGIWITLKYIVLKHISFSFSCVGENIGRRESLTLIVNLNAFK